VCEREREREREENIPRESKGGEANRAGSKGEKEGGGRNLEQPQRAVKGAEGEAVKLGYLAEGTEDAC
jgi:hypothetical protein